MNLHHRDNVAVIQQGVGVLGELIAAAGLDREVVVYDDNPWRVESSFRLSPTSSELTWNAPRYVHRDNLKIQRRYDHNKVLLDKVLLHNDNLKPMLRQITSILKLNDEVIVFEQINNCCYHGVDCKEVKSAEEIERLITSRSFRLVERKEIGYYLLARFKYAPF